MPAIARGPDVTEASLTETQVSTVQPSWLPKVSGHIPALDGLRGLAILFAMMPHISMVVNHEQPDSVLGRLTSSGWIGVDLFFVLSGFLITGILFDAKNGQNYFKNFYIRRILRIFPLHYAFLFFVFFVVARIMSNQV